MSTSQSPRPPALPSAAVDRVFARLLAIFGAQRTAAAWDAVPQADRMAVWSTAIGRAVWCRQRQAFDLQAVADALDELAAEPTSWLPSSGEFADRCERHAQRPGRRLALPVPGRTADEIEAGRKRMDEIKAMLRGSVKRVPA